MNCLIASVLLPSLVLSTPLKGLNECMNTQDCLGQHRVCSHEKQELKGECVCEKGYELISPNSFACVKKDNPYLHKSCNYDQDCKDNEVCMSWKYDPALAFARKLRSRISPESETPEHHQFCIDAWVIYKNHFEAFDEPRTGGGLRSRNFDAMDEIFGNRHHPRVQQQYIGFAEDMMLILFLVCILATLVTVHRAACYRSLQDARRNTPLRHLLPIIEDRPPPYVTDSHDSADGLAELVNSVPKPQSETPPPSYEEALYRQSVRLPSDTDDETVRRPTDSDEATRLPSSSEATAETHEETSRPSAETSEETSETSDQAMPVDNQEESTESQPSQESSASENEEIEVVANQTSSAASENISTDETTENIQESDVLLEEKTTENGKDEEEKSLNKSMSIEMINEKEVEVSVKITEEGINTCDRNILV